MGVFWNKQSSESWVTHLNPGFSGRLSAELVKRYQMGRGLEGEIEPVLLPFRLQKLAEKADVLHFHILHEHSLSFHTLSRFLRFKPTLWTWHDLWPVTGHCIFPQNCERWSRGCGNCPDLFRGIPTQQDRTSDNYQRKIDFLKRHKPNIHVSTRWMKERIEPHISAAELEVSVIPFGIDLKKFTPGNRESARANLKIPSEAFVIFARGTPDPRKNFVLLAQAIELIDTDRQIFLITIDDTSYQVKRDGVIQRDYGWLNDTELLQRLFAASDIVFAASREESFGVFALESMACGIPPLHTGNSATSEIVGDQSLALEDMSLRGLTNALQHFVDDPQILLPKGRLARKRAEKEYDLAKFISRLSDRYLELIDGR